MAGWVLMIMERCETQKRLSNNIYKKTQIKRQLQRLSSFSSSIADGQVTPSEIASLGSNLFGSALDFMGYGRDAAAAEAQNRTSYYASAYQDVTQEQYYNNGALSAQAQLYFDPQTGELDEQRMYNEFYEELLKEYVDEYVEPMIKEQEDELQNQLTDLEAQCEMDEAYLSELEGATSKATPKIKLS